MLVIEGSPVHHCDGLSRRSFLRLGGLAMGGLNLPQLLHAEDIAGQGRSHKSVIMVFLAGGPPHQDMVDLKPEAPVEFRGEFTPISTNVPGLQVCEHMPKLAQRMDQLVAIRSLVGSAARHAAFQCMHAHPSRNQPPGGWPSFGSAVSKLRGPVVNQTPPYIALQPGIGGAGWHNPGRAGFAGMAHAPFTPNSSVRYSPETGVDEVNLVLEGLNLEKLRDRQTLLGTMDNVKRQIESSDLIDAMDTYRQQAFDILMSGKIAKALDFEQEPESIRERYGRGSNEPAGYGDAGWLRNEDFLVARRLIEAGARVVSLSFGRWDWHGQPHGTNFDNGRDHIPALDQALSALIDDLKERGMDEDVTVVVWGEFGRTPRVNKSGGRDHWPAVACALLAGGGMQTGQMVGTTNSRAEHPIDRPVHFQEVFATLYHNLGIDIEQETINDHSGRPQYLIDHSKYHAMPELIRNSA